MWCLWELLIKTKMLSLYPLYIWPNILSKNFVVYGVHLTKQRLNIFFNTTFFLQKHPIKSLQFLHISLWSIQHRRFLIWKHIHTLHFNSNFWIQLWKMRFLSIFGVLVVPIFILSSPTNGTTPSLYKWICYRGTSR